MLICYYGLVVGAYLGEGAYYSKVAYSRKYNVNLYSENRL